MATSLSDAGRAFLERQEGCKLTAYQDTRGIWTIGFGHTTEAGDPYVYRGLEISTREADMIFAKDLAPIVANMSWASSKPLTQNQFDACISLAYNIGVARFFKSTVMHQMQLGNIQGAADAFLLWRHPPELLPRRQRERTLFLDGVYT